MSRLDLSPNKQHKLLSRIAEKSNLNGESLAKICRVHPRTFRDWKRGKYKVSDQALRRLCDASGVAMPKTRVLPEFWSTRKAGRLGGLARYRLYGSPGTLEGRSKGGRKSIRVIRQRLQADPGLAERWGAEFIGILLGDGGIRNNALQVTVSFNQAKESEYAEWVQRTVKDLFGLKSSQSLRKNNFGGDVVISSVKLVKYLGKIANLSPGDKIRNGLDVPPWIWRDRSYHIACLRGLMDTDGGPYIHRYQVNGKWYAYPKLCFSSAAAPLRKSVIRLFENLGFHPRLARSNLIFIDRSEEARKFYQIVGSRHKRHHKLISGFS